MRTPSELKFRFLNREGAKSAKGFNVFSDWAAGKTLVFGNRLLCVLCAFAVQIRILDGR